MDSLLSEEEKVRIRQEEFFRAQLRKELSPPAPTPPSPGLLRQIWELLNSKLVMWLLSSVVLSLIVHRYDQAQDARKARETKDAFELAEKVKHRDTYQRVALEISYRLSSTMTRLKAVSKKYGPELSAESQKAVVRAFEPLSKPANDETPPLYPEYKFYSGLALIAELRNHAGEAERQSLTETLGLISGTIERLVSEPNPQTTVEVLAADFLKQSYYKNWSNNGFPYTAPCDKAPYAFC